MDNTRNAELAAIHVAKKQLRLDEATYRSIVEMVSARFGHPVSSAGLMGSRERRALLEQLRSWGFRRAETVAQPSPQHPQVQKILALWQSLIEAGAVTAPDSMKALRAFCKRQTGVEAPAWLSAAQSNKVIEGLKAWLERHFNKLNRGIEDEDGGSGGAGQATGRTGRGPSVSEHAGSRRVCEARARRVCEARERAPASE